LVFSIYAICYSYLYFSCLNEVSTLVFSSSISCLSCSCILRHCSITDFLTSTMEASYSSTTSWSWFGPLLSIYSSLACSSLAEVTLISYLTIVCSLAYSVTEYTKTVPSAPALKTYLPSGEVSILVTSPRCALKVSKANSCCK
jgi:hypothetical protein